MTAEGSATAGMNCLAIFQPPPAVAAFVLHSAQR
jgi:hypothetical protein